MDLAHNPIFCKLCWNLKKQGDYCTAHSRKIVSGEICGECGLKYSKNNPRVSYANLCQTCAEIIENNGKLITYARATVEQQNMPISRRDAKRARTHQCKDCGKDITGKSLRCRSCNNIFAGEQKTAARIERESETWGDLG